jgi:hypothetical protein
MTDHRQPWYLDRLRAELERVAAIEDRRERGPALGRLRPVLDRLRPSPQTLVALAVVVALVAVVLAVGRVSDVERPVTPQPSPAPGVQGACVPSKWWKAPIVDEPIPQAIVSRFALFRDHPRPTGELPRDLRDFWGAKKLYRGALTLRPRLDTGARLRVALFAADLTDADVGAAIEAQRGYDFCAPPPDPIVPGICVAAFPLNGTKGEANCFSIGTIEDAEAWVGVTRQTVFGLAPDGVDRVTFDTPTGTQSLNISSNVYAGEMRSARNPHGTNPRFTP